MPDPIEKKQNVNGALYITLFYRCHFCCLEEGRDKIKIMRHERKCKDTIKRFLISRNFALSILNVPPVMGFTFQDRGISEG